MRLWIPFGVSDIDSATAFYTDRLGLTEVDGWRTDGERGVVLAAGDGAYVELVAPGVERRSPLAFELADQSEVDRLATRWTAAELVRPPARYPRGHYGFEVAGPAGAQVLVWSER